MEDRIRSRGAHETPAPVARYVVEHSLGRWLWDGAPPPAEERADPGAMRGRRWRTLASVARIRVLDPACGSGVLLLAAFDCLLDWYLQRARWRPEGGAPGPCARIASRHLFGIDVDPRAVEDARRSLSLRSRSPDEDALAANLRCADTLAGPAVFPRIVAQGGFHFVLGNPPYVFGGLIGADQRRAYRRYQLGRGGQPDLYKLFFERTAGDLLRRGGVHAFVVPDAILGRDDHRDVRAWIAQHLEVVRACHVGPVFTRRGRSSPHATASARVGVSCVVLVARKRPGALAARARADADPCQVDTWTGDGALPSHALAPSVFAPRGDPWTVAAPEAWYGEAGLKARMEAAPLRLRHLLAPGTLGATRGEELGKSSLRNCPRPGLALPLFTPIYTGADVQRHHLLPARKQVPTSRLSKPAAYYAGPKVCFVKTGAGPVAAACTDDLPVLQSLYVLHLGRGRGLVTEEILAALLCSAPVTAYAHHLWTSGKQVHPQLTLDNVRELPVPVLRTEVAGGLARRARRLRACLAELRTATTPSARARLQAESGRLERTIDALVCEAYGLDLEELGPVLSPAFRVLPASQRPRWWRDPGERCPQATPQAGRYTRQSISGKMLSFSST